MRRVHIAPVAAALAALLGSSGTVSAAPTVHETFHDEFGFTDEDFCGTGLSIDIAGTVDGRATIRTKGRDHLIAFAEHIIVNTSFTNPDGGASINAVERSLSKDLHVIDNDDGTLTVVVLATGNYTMYSADGRTIGRNPGQFRFQLVVDHNGTPGDPDDDFEISFDVLKESTGRSDDFCAIALDHLT